MANFFQTYRLQENGFIIFVIISFIIYLSTALGIAIISPTYIDTLDYWVRFYIALFLLIRFNPFVGKIHFTDLDRKIAFNAGLFLLTTIGVKQILQNYIANYVKASVSDIETKISPNSNNNHPY